MNAHYEMRERCFKETLDYEHLKAVERRHLKITNCGVRCLDGGWCSWHSQQSRSSNNIAKFMVRCSRTDIQCPQEVVALQLERIGCAEFAHYKRLICNKSTT